MGRRAFLRPVPVLAAMLLLGGCGSAAVETFNLSAPTQNLGGRAGRGQLVVMEPVATAPYDSDRIVVRTAPGSVAYLKGAQWSEQLPRLLQSRIVQTFENSRLLRAVGRPGDRLVATVSLNMEIRRFDIDVQSGQAVVEISAKMISDAAGRIRGARIFRASAPGSASNGRAASAALDQAMEQVLREMIAWSSAYV
ncbi:MAG: ABC-type transport auxiliary lipoprotein family protein [Beijerinckiaceae bacterium]